MARVCAIAALVGLLASFAEAQNPGACGPWVRAEYLAWQTDGVDLPALVTSSPSNVPLDDAGVLGEETTTILAGNGSFADGYRSGFRISAGMPIDPCGNWQLTGDYFFLGRDDYDFAAGDTASTIITRPFFNTQANEQDTQQVSVPNQLSGTVVGGYGDRFQGAGLALTKNIVCCCDPCGGASTQLAVLGGYRYYKHDSDLAVVENLTVLANTTTPLIPGTTIALDDRFAANNEFHGAEVGLTGRVQKSEWWIDGLAAFAFGSNRRTIDISGSTTNTVPNVGTSTAAGGLLTSSETNIGRYTDSRDTVIPRLRLGLGCQLTCHWSATLGYNAIIWQGVATAADGLPADLAVDPRNLPPVQTGGNRNPEFAGFRDETFVAHGLDVGVTYAF